MSVQIHGKWVTVAPADTATGEVASTVIAARLIAVQRYLPLAAYHAEEDVEHVHQLRVSCRRADAAIAAFGDWLGSQKKTWRRRLKRIRRAAGPARDADVFMWRLHSEPQDDQRAADALLEALVRRREAAQPSLVKAAERAKNKDLPALTSKTVATIESAGEPGTTPQPFQDFARQAVAAAAGDCLEQMEAESTEQLHQLRIAGKHLRYSIELFHSPLDPKVRLKLYPMIVALQDRLGAINDLASAQRMLQSWLAELPPDGFAADVAARIVDEFDRTQSALEAFRQWWTAKRRDQFHSELSAVNGDR